MIEVRSIDTKPSPRLVLTQFTIEEFELFWPKLEETLDSVPHTWRHWTKEHIYSSATSNTLQVWGIGPPGRSILVLFTTVNVFPAMKILTVAWAAGTFVPAMVPVLDAAFTKYARFNDCDEIEIRGRLGWEPKLKSLGFRHDASVWTRRIPNVRMN